MTKALFDSIMADELSPEEEAQISELSELLVKKETKPPKSSGNGIKASLPSCRNMTKSLVHYFLPKNTGELNATFQLIITGAESFNSHFRVIGNECDYFDGQAQSPDITIITDSAVWMDLLKGKMSCQRAFMGGKVKVRGNFVLLAKFDQIFDMRMT